MQPITESITESNYRRFETNYKLLLKSYITYINSIKEFTDPGPDSATRIEYLKLSLDTLISLSIYLGENNSDVISVKQHIYEAFFQCTDINIIPMIQKLLIKNKE